MIIALALAVALAACSYGSFRCAFAVPTAAGAGAVGSIILAGSVGFGALSIFCFGVAAGLAIQH